MTNENGKLKFTKREKNLLQQMKMHGFYPKVMIEQACITIGTFYTHIRNMHRKTGTHNPAELMKFIYDHAEAIED